MDEQLRIILIIIVSVSIFGLLVFVFVKNYIRNKINHLVKEEEEEKEGGGEKIALDLPPPFDDFLFIPSKDFRLGRIEALKNPFFLPLFTSPLSVAFDPPLEASILMFFSCRRLLQKRLLNTDDNNTTYVFFKTYSLPD